MEEKFDLVNENDQVIGTVLRSEAHGNPSLIHRVAHVLVFNSLDKLYLQKRAFSKTVQPGKWDTSVGGHVDAGEGCLNAAVRETAEELGISSDAGSFVFLYKYLHRNDYESEYVSTYRLIWDGDIRLQESEIDDGRFWTVDEILKTADSDSGIFTPNFLDELGKYLEFTSDPQ